MNVSSDLWIGGLNRRGGGVWLTSRCPSDQAIVFQGPSASESDVRAAWDAASAAASAWAAESLESRETILRAFAEQLSENAQALAERISCEVGKLPGDARGEVSVSIAKVETTIAAYRQRRSDWQAGTADGQQAVWYRPLGPVLVLGPYNFPAHLPGGQIIPALLAGNTVVFKPSELAPAVGRWLVDQWRAAGLPAGVLNLIQGDATVARQAIDDNRVRGVFFTGGRTAGTAIHRQLAGRPEVLLALEMGGNNPLVVVDPPNAEDAAEVIIQSAFASSGQRCTCTRRLILVEGAATRAAYAALVERLPTLTCGLPDDQPEPALGPLVSTRHANLVLQAEANFLAYGGQAVHPLRQDPRCGALLHPGLVDMTQCHDPVDEEWFGPLLQVYWVRDFQAAIERANATAYGLAAALWGGDAEMFAAFRQAVAAGVINWNAATTGASGKLPFGGLAGSGNHRPAGSFTVDFCNDPVASLQRWPGRA